MDGVRQLIESQSTGKQANGRLEMLRVMRCPEADRSVLRDAILRQIDFRHNQLQYSLQILKIVQQTVYDLHARAVHSQLRSQPETHFTEAKRSIVNIAVSHASVDLARACQQKI